MKRRPATRVVEAKVFEVAPTSLKEYRSKGEQKMTVQHVNISDGGQAIIGA
jgi:hypothetical protein